MDHARVSEVAARFTLDAMPGKQMSIDADLNSGLIDEIMAKKRRQDLQAEADFYGAMDGASKFVKGDAVAGIIITIINIIAGIIIGVMQLNMSAGQAAAIIYKAYSWRWTCKSNTSTFNINSSRYISNTFWIF